MNRQYVVVDIPDSVLVLGILTVVCVALCFVVAWMQARLGR